MFYDSSEYIETVRIEKCVCVCLLDFCRLLVIK